MLIQLDRNTSPYIPTELKSDHISANKVIHRNCVTGVTRGIFLFKRIKIGTTHQYKGYWYKWECWNKWHCPGIPATFFTIARYRPWAPQLIVPIFKSSFHNQQTPTGYEPGQRTKNSTYDFVATVTIILLCNHPMNRQTP